MLATVGRLSPTIGGGVGATARALGGGGSDTLLFWGETGGESVLPLDFPLLVDLTLPERASEGGTGTGGRGSAAAATDIARVKCASP